MTERQILLRKVSTYAFAILDLQIFLDTHPNDERTLARIRKFEQILAPLRREYEEKYGPLTKMADTNNWTWVNSPWPWETEEKK